MDWVVRERPGDREDAARWRERAARAGERIAEEMLRLRGFAILDRNVRSGRGEIDLIARDGDTVVFVEVKLRTGSDPAAALAAVNWKKRIDVERAATRWLQSRGLTDRPVRFDVVGITWEGEGSRLGVEHVRNAFSGCGGHFF
ncbi:MAG: YraN family protein [Bacteroidota bacterium]